MTTTRSATAGPWTTLVRATIVPGAGGHGVPRG